jgi:hypothetical protein
MTREEAKSCIGTIEMLQRLAYNIHGVMDVIDADNCKKIIKALEQEPCEDAISRKAVINQIFYSTDNNGDVVLGSALRERIEKLPSVTPTNKECVDCVSRKAVLDMAKSYNTDGYDSYTPLVVDVEDIEELPSITPIRPKGH